MPPDLLQFSAPIELQAASDQSKPVRISIRAYTGDAMNVPGFGPTVIDLPGLDVSHPVQILAEHKDSIDGLLGTGTATKTRSDLQVHGTLTRANPMTERILAMSKDGVSFAASVGVQPIEREIIREGQTVSANGRTITAPRGGMVFVKRGVLRETSLEAIGADASASVAIAASAKRRLIGTRQLTESELLSPENVARVNASLPNEMRCAWDRDGLSDAERIEARLERFRRDFPETGEIGRGMVRAAASGTLDWPSAEREILRAENRALQSRAFRAELPKAPAIHSSRSDAGSDEDMLQASLLLHMGHEQIAVKALGEQTTESARRLHLNSLHDIMRAALQQAGVEVPAGRDSMIRAAFSTNSVSGILSNTANKISTDSYRAAPSVARVVARKLTANDFKDHTGYRLTADATFDEVGNAGEIKHGSLGESSFTFKVATHARMFGLTRQDVINDDLGKFDEVPRLLGRGAAVKLEQLFWTLVLANTGDFFHADNSNLITDALAIDGLSSAVETLRKLVDANGDPISITPKFLVCPPELEAVADQLFASTNLIYGGDTAVPDSNPFKGKYQPQVSPYLSNENYPGYSATGWYLFGDPVDVAAFGIAYLNGIENPTIEQADADFNTLGIQFRGYLDFGVCQIDKAGAVKSTGVGE